MSVVAGGASILAVGVDYDTGAELMVPVDGGLAAAASLTASACAASFPINVELEGPPVRFPMTSCGTNCGFVAWYDFPGCEDAGYPGTFQVDYAFVGTDGCVTPGSSPAFLGKIQPGNVSPVSLAVASQPGSVLLAYAENGASTNAIDLVYCTP